MNAHDEHSRTFKKKQIIHSAVPEPYFALSGLGFGDHLTRGLKQSFGTPGWYMAPFHGLELSGFSRTTLTHD